VKESLQTADARLCATEEREHEIEKSPEECKDRLLIISKVSTGTDAKGGQTSSTDSNLKIAKKQARPPRNREPIS